MATTKTLTPTNKTITIDAFQGEKPDHRHVADAETKLADAVNALNSQLVPTYSSVTLASGITGTIYIMRMGKLRVLTGYFNPNASGVNITIATLDEQDRPPVNIQGNFAGYGVTATGELNINSAGTFQCSVNAAPSNTLKFNIAYAVS